MFLYTEKANIFRDEIKLVIIHNMLLKPKSLIRCNKFNFKNNYFVINKCECYKFFVSCATIRHDLTDTSIFFITYIEVRKTARNNYNCLRKYKSIQT